jgi:hypothetical protein
VKGRKGFFINALDLVPRLPYPWLAMGRSEMNGASQNRSLAHEIGLCRIAMIVDRFHQRIRRSPEPKTCLA